MARLGSSCRCLTETAGPESRPGGGNDLANVGHIRTAVRSAALEPEFRRLTPVLPGGWSSGRTDVPGMRAAGAHGDGRGLADADGHHGMLPAQGPWPGRDHQAPAESCDPWRCQRHGLPG